MTTAVHNHDTALSQWVEIVPEPIEDSDPEERPVFLADEIADAIRWHDGHTCTVENYGQRIVCTDCGYVLVEV